MVIAPPSKREDGTYRWLNDLPIAEAPAWLIEQAIVAGSRQATADANGDDASASEEWRELLDNIRNGRALHDSLRDLAAKLIVGGTSGGVVTNLLYGFHDLYAPEGKWKEPRADIPRAVVTAEEKYVRGEANADSEQPVLRSYFAEELEQQPVEEVDWIVPGFIPNEAVTGMFGDGGTGKDLLLFMLGTSAISGCLWLGKEVKECRVIYYPVEDNDKELRRRQAAIAEHYGIRYVDFAQQFKITPFAGKDTVLAAFDQRSGVIKPTRLFDTVRKEIEDFKPTLVIVGNRVNIFGVNQNDDAQARQCIQLLAGIALDYKTAVVMPGHVSVAGLASNSGTSGSVQWSNGCRSRLFLSRIIDAEGDEPDKDARQLEVRKANWGPTDQKINIRWSDGVFTVNTEAMQSFVQRLATNNAEQEFLRMLDLSVEKVSLKAASNNYAPKIFSDDLRCKLKGRPGKKALAAAMNGLWAKGIITTEPYGPPSNRHECIVRGPK